MSKTSNPTLSVVIVSYNTRQLTLECIESLLTQDFQPLEIIIVDNASSDSSGEAIRTQYPTVQMISQSENKYFSAANNTGIRAATGQYILVLNPDTQIRQHQ